MSATEEPDDATRPPVAEQAPPSQDDEQTRPPAENLRFDTPQDLYAAMPQVAELTQRRPQEGEDMITYLYRLRSSTTPEEAVTFTAFAAIPQRAIWWAHECLRAMPEKFDATDHEMMARIARWVGDPTQDRRHRIMRDALWAPRRSPVILLALAVGWSGGSIAPNDPAPVAPYRAPRSINSAILSCLATAPLNRRSILLARFIDMAESVLRVY
ncbi:DUF6931 family protein [Aestuariibius sp. 2305UL40-4]|uniref:DUF6931 family protein n=1 Tax=Aestuariibius violaceus TaxID=3234132 RepID=UPI00345E7FC3